MIRLTGGALRGRRLTAGRGVRPTMERTRKAAFDILGPVAGTRVLDAAAGTGAYGLEALSRGAREAVFVESDRRNALAIRASLERLGLSREGVVVGQPISTFLSGPVPEPFDLVFFDPPYGDDPESDVAGLHAVLKPEGILVLERPARGAAPPGAHDERRYGESRLLFYRAPRLV